MALDVDLDDLIGYFGTWSSVQRYRRETERDPLPELATRLAPPWGPRSTTRHAHWPLSVRVGVV
jgi:hypothetical protein